MLAVLACASAAPRAGTVTVFGPRTYTRTTGQPVTVSDTFDVATPTGSYTLRVESDGIASAVIAVNGREIVGVEDFTNKVMLIERRVAINRSNGISVELRSTPGSRLVISIVGEETPNHAPQITSSPVTAATATQAYGYQVTATDADGDALTFGLTTFPTGMTMGPTTGLISWTPTAGQTGPHDVTVTVSDGKGGSDAQSFTITVAAAPPNRPPVANAGGPYSGTVDEPVGFSGGGSSDPDGDALTYAWDFGDQSQGAGATPQHLYATVGSFTVTLVVTDAHGASHSVTTTCLVGKTGDRAPPLVTLTGPASALPGSRILVTATADDNVGVASLRFEVSGLTPSTVPSPPYQRTIDVPQVAAPGDTIQVRAIATDFNSNTAQADYVVTIVAIPDTENPTVSLGVPPEIAPGAALRITATAHDNVGVARVIFSVNGVSVGTDETPPYESSFAVPADAPVGGTLSIVARAVDFSDNAADSRGSVAIVATADAVSPVVALTAPAEILAGQALSLSATASDNVGVATVALLVDGAQLRTLTTPPYEASYVVPRTMPPGTMLRLAAVATDFSSNEGRAAAETRVVAPNVAGLGVVTGEVYADRTGLPLEGATVAIMGADATGTPYDRSTVTDRRGRYALSIGAGHGLVEISKTGWMRVQRPVDVTAGRVVEAVDARLTPVADASAPITPVIGGKAGTADAELTVAAGGLAEETAIAVTSVSQQGLEALLPPGWSPVGMADVWPRGVTFQAATLRVKNAFRLAAGTALVLAVWDDAAGAWRAIGPSVVPDDGKMLAGDIPHSGQFAWILSDSVPAAPPVPAAGEIVRGVSVPVVPDAVATAITPQPKISIYRPGVVSDVRGVLTGASPLSSGALIWARVSETYRFRSGGEASPEPFVEDLILFQAPPSGAAVAASFPVSPSLTFEAASLDRGVITVELSAPSGEPDVPVIVGADGVTVVAGGDRQLQIPAGALAEPAAVAMHGLAQASLGVTLPASLEFLDAIEVSLIGTLGQPAVLSVPLPAGMTDASRVLLLRLEQISTETKLVVVGIAAITDSRLVSQTMVGGDANVLEGIRTAGRYLLVRAAEPFGFALGQVLGVSASPFAGAVVSSTALPVVALSNAAGRYGLAVALGNVALTALDPVRSDTGSGSGVIASAGEVLALDLQLVAQVPRVVSISPASGAASVPLANPVVIIFSEPIDPASVTGSNAQRVSLASAAGPVAGTLALSTNDTVATFRPVEPLLPNTSYTITVAAAVQDRAGYAMAAPFVSPFSSLDTLPPPTPPAGSVQASVPGADGNARITATQGTAGPHDTVTVVNTTTKAITPVLVDSDGGFAVVVPLGLKDKVQLRIVDAAGNETIIDIPALGQTNADGSVSKVIGPDGGRVDGDHGVAVDVPAGTFPDGAVVTVKAVLPEDFPVALPADAQQRFRLDGGVKLDFGGAEPTRYVNVSIPAAGDEKPDGQWVVSRVADLGGQAVLDVVDSGKLLGGRITTSSPPCPGVTKQGTYGLYRSDDILGWNYTYLSSVNGTAVLEARTDVKAVLSWFSMPWLAIEPPAMQPVCYPVISGRVTVAPNSVKVQIPGEVLTPADREIIIRNQVTGTEQHYPRSGAEFVFEMSGSDRDGYRVVVSGPAGEQQVRAIGVTAGVTGTVVVRFSPDVVTVPVERVVITNLTTAADHVSLVTTEDLTLAADGGEGDAREVTARAVAAGVQPRSLPFTVIPSPYGPGNLLLRALEGTFDPSPPRGAVYLNGMQVPESAIVDGGIAWAFDGSFSDRFVLTVEYPGSNSIVVKIPSFQVIVKNPQTGKVIKTISGQSPPRDQPLSLGVISDDMASPFVIGGPSRINSFDPAGLITFTFSEPMDADSVKSNFIVQDENGAVVQGEVRISSGNRVATFVPRRPLKLGATYTLTLKGNDELGALLVPDKPVLGPRGITDVSGNPLPTTRLTIKVFGPRLVGGLLTGSPVNDVAFERKRLNNALTTFVFAATNSAGTDKVVSIDANDAANPVKVAGNGDQAQARKRITIVPGVSVGGLSNGDLAVTASFNLYYSFLNYYDVTNPTNIRWLANKLLTATPDFLTPFNNRGTYHIQGFSRGVAALKTADGVYAYAAVQNVGVMAADVGRGIPEPGSSTRFLEAMYPGDFVDITAVYDKLLAVRRVENQLFMFDANLSPLMQFDLPDIPRRVTAVSGFPIDGDGDGVIGQNEIYDLAIVACEQSILIIDLAEMLSGQAAGLPIIGTIPRTAITREIDIDAGRQRLFAGGDDGLLIIDLSKPRDSASSNDLDGDGIDDRIIWTNPNPRDVGGLKIDADRGVLYVGHGGGVDLWAVYENCCDIGVDMNAEPKENLVADRTQLLINEKKALQQAIGKGLGEAASGCGVDTTAISILEQGSGACLWKGDPSKTCSENYQPGISDHDFEVFLPSGQMGPTGTCVAKKLIDQFRDPETGELKPVELPSGTKMTFEDISFFPMPKDEFERAKLNVMPPTDPAGNDPTGDLGLGRQGLLLKWLLEGQYIEVPGHPMSGESLGTILEILKTQTGIPRLEGYEWAMLQDFALAKSKARVRVAGASDTNSFFYKLYIKQLHDAGKAGIRAALGGMLADQLANRIVLDISREQYDSTGCLAIRAQLSDPNAWSEKPCRSFEEYVASAAAKTLRGWTPLTLFTRDVVVHGINRFFRVKSDLEPIASEADANEVIASAAKFIDTTKAATETIFNLTVGQDPDGQQRMQNVGNARQKTDKALKEAHLQPVPHLYNRGFVMGRQLRVAMYADSQLLKESAMDLAGGENLYPKYERNPDGSLKLDPDNKPIPLYDVGPIDQAANLGQPKPIAYTIDLPDATMKEANRANNVGGFYYYTLNVNSPAPPQTPAQPPPPVLVPGPNPECEDGPVLRITQQIVAGNQVLDHDAVLGLGEQVKLRIVVENLSSSEQSDIVVCSTLLSLCKAVGTLAVGGKAKVDIDFTVPADGVIADIIATVYGPMSGVQTSAPLRLMASCEYYEVIPPDRNPNPKDEDSKVMIGGSALRYYSVINRRSGEPVAGAAVSVQAQSATESRAFEFTTDSNGIIVAPNEPGMSFYFANPDVVGTTFDLKVGEVGGIAPMCSAPVAFKIGVEKRAHSQSYSRGIAIQGSIGLFASIEKSAEEGFEMSREEETAGATTIKALTLKQSLKSGTKSGISFSFLNLSADVGVGKLSLGGEVGLTEKMGDASFETYRYPYPLSREAQCSIAAVTLRGLYGINPLFNKLLDLFRTDPCPDPTLFRSSAGEETSREASIQGSFKLGATRPTGGDKQIGVTFGASGSSGFGFGVAFGRNYAPSGGTAKVASKTQGYTLRGGVDFTAGLTIDPSDPPHVQDDLKTTHKVFDRTLNTGLSYSTAELYGVQFLNTIDSDEPSAISVTYQSPKGFGWTRSIFGAATQLAGRPDRTLTWKISDPADVALAVDTLANVKAIRNSDALAQLGLQMTYFLPTVLVGEHRKFEREVLPQTRTSYTITQKDGSGYSAPFGANVALGPLKAGLSFVVKADSSVGFIFEKGVNVKGATYPLEKYTRDSFIPDADLNLFDIVVLSWKALISSFASHFSDHLLSIDLTNPNNPLRSTGSATLTIDGTKESEPFDATVFSYHFSPVEGPVKDARYMPADVAGPAGQPHYGIGGFHQFGPAGRSLGASSRLVIDYDDGEVSGLDESQFAIYAYNDDTKDWDLVGGTVDAAANTVTAAIDTMRLYTIGMPMPKGDIGLDATAGELVNETITFTVTSGTVVSNNGQPVPDGTLFSVRNVFAGGTSTEAYGDVLTADADAQRENVQVASSGGRITFQVRYPAPNNVYVPGRVVVYSTQGTAFGELVIATK